MQSLKTTHVSPKEWRWVFIVSGLLTAVTLLPYAWALAANTTANEWQFMGILVNPQDGATYLSKIGLGIRGNLLIQFMHTPAPHAGAAVQIFYVMLGHFARLIGVSPLVIYHLARVLTTLFMFIALYQFSAAVWPRQRPRRLFFVMVSLGSGLGWLALVINPNLPPPPDLSVAEAYPLYAAFTNPHFPLAIGCLALLAAQYVDVFQVDFVEEPSVGNGGLGVFLLTLVTAFIFPQALVPLGSALMLYVAIISFRDRRIPVLELRWLSMFMLPAGLIAFYFYAVVRYNPAIAAWNKQTLTLSNSPLMTFMGYGLLLLLAVPGLVRAVRQFEKDGDRLMLFWLITNFVLLYLPFNHQRRFMVGLIMPITFFAVRSLEGFWLPRIPEKWQMISVGLLFVFLVPSYVLALGGSLLGLVDPDIGFEHKLLVENGYWEAMNWLAEQGGADRVVLAEARSSLWIPAYGEKRVVYGHPWDTLDAPERLQQVEDFFAGDECYWPTMADDGYVISYVLVGPQERALSEADGASDRCYADLETRSTEVIDFDDVVLYELAPLD